MLTSRSMADYDIWIMHCSQIRACSPLARGLTITVIALYIWNFFFSFLFSCFVGFFLVFLFFPCYCLIFCFIRLFSCTFLFMFLLVIRLYHFYLICPFLFWSRPWVVDVNNFLAFRLRKMSFGMRILLSGPRNKHYLCIEWCLFSTDLILNLMRTVIG